MESDTLLTKQLRRQRFLKELEQELSNPLHLRLLQAYRDEDPVRAMEDELTKILTEVLQRED